MAIQDPPFWPEVLRKIVATGLSQAEIARRVGLSQPTVSNLLSGKIKTTGYGYGVKIMALHKAVTRSRAGARLVAQVPA